MLKGRTSRSADAGYGVFVHDWRLEPAQVWLRLKAEHGSRLEDMALRRGRPLVGRV